ncbi:ImmA/IrrE family metallo-endopeptidase [Paenibacillus sp. HWE-109]|uniref:ImmA/IrrE family metallo-endopeptidase n=1 Tax=Paenibacillus sp. HWE-109 TaxID=1306526 RepID=UPI001EDD2CED|nr:ImmA/IrrE family metallo-endopeptidase [Paenibacillus sp. HWE-109]UKS27165.1 ImmA/IrrE family metallo-endopeptidase [Paenibacillus sp. HWE-109]
MDLTHYKPTALEELISRHYQQGNIHYPSDLDIEMIADLFQIDIAYREDKSFVHCIDDDYFIVIDARLRPEQRREVFFHELGHFLLHYGDQGRMPELFKELQEMQAMHFQYYAAMPYYMLADYRYINPSLLVKTISEEFQLPPKFIERRLEQIKRRIYVGQQDHEINTRWSTPVKVTKEDIRIVLEEFTRRKKERERAY